jgi:hypothetical protein
MKFKVKAALLALSAGMIALQSSSCFFKWLGDAIGDWVWFRNIA